ncbi:hypothetical protein B0H14DRAFT_1165807 [Mycena olivaceomarginata]|nr:hypothetical protein B0H14DRAFT_1165807 [Mycena olivaceomarginata]
MWNARGDPPLLRRASFSRLARAPRPSAAVAPRLPRIAVAIHISSRSHFIRTAYPRTSPAPPSGRLRYMRADEDSRGSTWGVCRPCGAERDRRGSTSCTPGLEMRSLAAGGAPHDVRAGLWRWGRVRCWRWRWRMEGSGSGSRYWSWSVVGSGGREAMGEGRVEEVNRDGTGAGRAGASTARHFIAIAYRWIPVHDALASALPLPAEAMNICGQRPALPAFCSYKHSRAPRCRAMPRYVDDSSLAERRLCLFSGTTLSTHQRGLCPRAQPRRCPVHPAAHLRLFHVAHRRQPSC